MIMDYEKEYKDALERARNLHKDAIDMEDSLRAKMAEIIFPELKESDGEKKLKESLMQYLWDMYHKDFVPLRPSMELCDKWLALLEKQETSYTKKDVDDAYLKGISDTKNEIERQYEANYQIRKDIATFIFNYRGDIKDRAKWMGYLGIKVSFDEVIHRDRLQGKSALEAIKEEKVDNDIRIKPKFKIGDWVVRKKRENFSNGRKAVQITNIAGEQYWLDYGTWLKAKDIRLWTIQDAEDGDVLMNDNDRRPFIFKGLIDPAHPNCPVAYCGIDSMHGFRTSSGEHWWTDFNVKPATKEQRDFLFSKMKEAGYEWDTNKRELIKL